jgi:hypothetical protein
MGWELGELTERQEARLAELGVDLNGEQRFRLRALAKLRNAESEWRAARLATIHYATQLADAGTVHIDQILEALAISRTTWLRRRAELRTTLAGGAFAAAKAAGDQAAAGWPGRDDEGNL